MRAAIIITCYNESSTIKEAVDSALLQTVRGQVIVVDDGSTDGSPEVLGRLDCDKIRITNRGQPAARTAGLLLLEDSVEWVVFLDGDDSLSPNYLAECLRTADLESADVVYSGMLRNGKFSMPLRFHPTEEEIWEQFPGWGIFMASRWLLSEMGGFHPAVGGEQDWDFLIDATRRGARMAYCQTAWFQYRDSPDGYSRSHSKVRRDGYLAEMRRHHHR